MRSTQVCIGIPVYKEVPSATEIQSLDQLFRVLGAIDTHFIVPQGFEGAFYRARYPRGVFVAFAADFFRSIEGYSLLLLEKAFYQQFSNYQYLLIYQTDAWVFQDQLLDWCSRGIDYVGAPWFDSAEPTAAPRMNGVGNGGLSLRRIPTFLRWYVIQERIEFLRSRHRQLGTLRLLFDLGRTLQGLKACTGTFSIAESLFPGKSPAFEDLFWTGNTWEEYKDGLRDLGFFFVLFLPWLYWRMKKPSPRQASRFSFEVHPSYLYESNKRQLPFGCHAWEKWEPEFWKAFIPGQRGSL